jgi:hypothetical protein
MSCPGVPVPVQDMSMGTVSTGKEAPSWFRSRRRAAGDLLSGGDFLVWARTRLVPRLAFPLLGQEHQVWVRVWSPLCMLSRGASHVRVRLLLCGLVQDTSDVSLTNFQAFRLV